MMIKERLDRQVEQKKESVRVCKVRYDYNTYVHLRKASEHNKYIHELKLASYPQRHCLWYGFFRQS